MPPQDLVVRMGLVFYGAMAIAAVVWRVGFDGESIWALRPIEPLDLARDAGLGLGLGAGAALLSQWITRATGWGDRLGRALAESLGRLSTANAVLLACASGLAEEMFFRGALQPHVGLVVASLLFGAVHFVPRRELLPWTVFAIVVGFGMGWLFEYTGNLLAPVLAHTAVNALNLPFLSRRYAA